MSNKFYCDVCGDEILMSSYGGGTYDKVQPNPEHFKDPQKNPPAIKVHKDICEKCCVVIDDAIDKLLKDKAETAKKAE